jgi:hypothetical protein
MNKVVREHYPASKLPDDLRRGISPDASVKVTIEEEVSRPASGETLAQQLLNVRKGLTRQVTIEEAAARIRELRDEWDDR